MSIVVFSENYANSTWCLDELWKILQCSKKSGHGVIPIFYKVKKSDVENQKGSFGAPFQTPKECFKGDEHKIGAWKASLRTASNIIGFVYPEASSETKFLDEITKETMRMLNRVSPCKTQDFPGIEPRSKELEELLMFDNDRCVRTIGVLGMAGIGKTLVADIDKELEWYQLCHLRENLLCKLLDVASLDERAYSWENYLRNKKLFIVLDNVTDKKQIDVLIGEKSLYRQGTRIVIITRDKKLLQNQADATYVVPRLNDREAMELFCLKAFPGNLFPPEEFMDLSYSFVDYSKGHPLALTLLGSDLLGNDKTYWSEKWKSLKVMPDKEIQKVLEKSYEKLDDKQKSIFLDIACFFRSEERDFVSSILKSDRVNAAAVMRELEDKCFVTISYNRLEMHDLLHTMGKKLDMNHPSK